MRRWLTIVWFRFCYMLKFPSNVIVIFALPITFSLIFGSINAGGGANQLPRAAIVYEADELSEAVAQLFTKNGQYDWIIADEAKANELVADREAVAAIIVPSNLLQRIEQSSSIFDVIVNQKTEQYIPLSSYIASIANQLYLMSSMVPDQALLQVLALANEQPVLDVQTTSFAQYQHSLTAENGQPNALVNNNDRLAAEGQTNTASGNTTTSIGFTIMFMMFALSGSAAIIHKERKDYTWQRLTTTSTAKASIVGGYITSFWLIGWLQFATMMIFMTIFYKTTWSNLAYIIAFMSIVIMCIVSYSMMMATLVSSKKQSGALDAIIIVSTCMLGGVYWPLEMVPQFMQQLANFIPQYWMMTGLNHILNGQLDWAIVWKSWVILIGISIAMLSIALRQLTKEQRV